MTFTGLKKYYEDLRLWIIKIACDATLIQGELLVKQDDTVLSEMRTRLSVTHTDIFSLL